MRVIGVEEFGGPEALRVFEVEEPHAGPGEVRVRVRAAAVSPTDANLRAGLYAGRAGEPVAAPHVPGMDVAGVVDEVGEPVGAAADLAAQVPEGAAPRLAVGDRVMGVVVPRGRHGAYSELVVLPAASVVAAPAGLSDAEASTLPMNGLTARVCLDLLALPAGATIAVTGAAGAYGGYVVQLAKADGLRVLADASERDEELVRSLGADVVVRRGDDVAARFREAAPDGVDGLADGSVQGAALFPALADGGAMAVVRGWDGPTDPTDVRGITVHPMFVGDHALETTALDGLRRAAESGAITARVARVLPAEQAPEAHRLLEAGGTRGRFVLEF